MNKYCWVCEQRAGYYTEKLNAARLAAKTKAINEQTTYAIWKEGPIWKNSPASEVGSHIDVIEFVSKYPETSSV